MQIIPTIILGNTLFLSDIYALFWGKSNSDIIIK